MQVSPKFNPLPKCPTPQLLSFLASQLPISPGETGSKELAAQNRIE